MDYNKYEFSKKEKIQFLLEVLGATALVAYLFYQSFFALILGIPLGILLYKNKKEKLKRARKKRLNEQFKDGILAVATALKVGYSIENAFVEAVRDLKLTYPKDADIVQEFTMINMQVKNNVVLEKLLLDFAERSHVDDIHDFAQVFVIAKRRGGDLSKIIKNTADIISEKQEVYREIDTILTAKQFEQQIMSVVPLLIILYVSLTSPHFLDTLYHNFFGCFIMTGCLAVYIVAVYLARKITTIEI